MNRQTILLNLLGYQLGWFAGVLGAAHGIWWLGPAIVLPWIIVHLRSARNPRAEVFLILGSTFLGCVFDQTLLLIGWVHYPPSPWPVWLLPLWMITLWMSYATTLNVSTRWLKQHLIVSIVFGAIGGPLAYGAGVKLGAMSWSADRPVAVALCIGFAVIVPLLYKLSMWFDGYGEALK